MRPATPAPVTQQAQYPRGAATSKGSSAQRLASNETPESIRAALIEEFGESGVAALESGGLLNIVASTSETFRRVLRIPGAGRSMTRKRAGRFLIADQLSAGRAVGAVLHELGEHHGLESFVRSAGWRALRVRLASMAKVRGSAAMGAWDAVKAV